MNFFRQLFVWWHEQTLGTRLTTLFIRKKVGTDQAGNRYYRHRAFEQKRWVVYHGMVEASKIPPDWHAWLHNMVRNPPRTDSANDYLSWYKPPLANMTGTKAAQLRKPASDDKDTPIEYEAWVPPEPSMPATQATQEKDS